MNDLMIASAQVGVASETLLKWSKSSVHEAFAGHLKECSDIILAMARSDSQGFPGSQDERIIDLICSETLDMAFRKAEAAFTELRRVLDSVKPPKRTVFY